MDQEIDHLKNYTTEARECLSTNSTLLVGLDEARAHQRGENVGKVMPAVKINGKLSPLLKQQIAEAEGTSHEVARRFGVGRSSVTTIRGLKQD